MKKRVVFNIDIESQKYPSIKFCINLIDYMITKCTINAYEKVKCYVGVKLREKLKIRSKDIIFSLKNILKSINYLNKNHDKNYDFITIVIDKNDEKYKSLLEYSKSKNIKFLKDVLLHIGELDEEKINVLINGFIEEDRISSEIEEEIDF